MKIEDERSGMAWTGILCVVIIVLVMVMYSIYDMIRKGQI